MDVVRYMNIAKLSNTEYGYKKLATYIPHPEEIDYKRGYIKRYFAQQSNDINAYIYEISSDVYSGISSNSFYTIVLLDWRLVGTEEQIKESNFKSVKLASQKMKALQLYLPNFLQFSKK